MFDVSNELFIKKTPEEVFKSLFWIGLIFLKFKNPESFSVGFRKFKWPEPAEFKSHRWSILFKYFLLEFIIDLIIIKVFELII